MGARGGPIRWRSGHLKRGPDSRLLIESSFALLRTSASLRQSSPPYRIRDRGAASPAGALRWRHVMAGGTKTPSSVAAPSRVKARDMPHGAFRWPHQRRGYEDKKRKRQRHWILDY